MAFLIFWVLPLEEERKCRRLGCFTWKRREVGLTTEDEEDEDDEDDEEDEEGSEICAPPIRSAPTCCHLVNSADVEMSVGAAAEVKR